MRPLERCTRASLSRHCRLLQASTIAPAVRIRENQRRARARGKEFIDDLKSRIRDYETQGVMATAQVQEAAQKVLLEDRRLCALLAERGVPIAEIELYLNGYDYHASFTVTLPTLGAVEMVNTQSQTVSSVDLQQPAKMHASDATNLLALAASPPAMPMDGGFESASQASKSDKFTGSSNDTELLRPDEQSEKDWVLESLLPNLLGPVLDYHCPEIEPVPGQAQSRDGMQRCGKHPRWFPGLWRR